MFAEIFNDQPDEEGDINEYVNQETNSNSSNGAAFSWYQLFKLQRDPYLRSLWKYRYRYLISVVLLLGQGALLVCRSLFFSIEDRVKVAFAWWGLATVNFGWHWVLIPSLPPCFASETGVPIYDDDDDLERSQRQ